MILPWKAALRGIVMFTAGVSSVFSFARVQAAAPDLAPPTIVEVFPAPGVVQDTFTSITVRFSKPVDHVDIDDLQINNLPVIGVSGNEDTYVFQLLQPSYGPVHVNWAANHGITDLSQPPLPFDSTQIGASWDYQFVDTQGPSIARLFPAPGSRVRSVTELELDFSESVQGLEAADLRVNGVPALGLVELSNGRYVFRFAQPPAGIVSFGWSPNHGIADLSEPPHPFSANTWTIQVDPTATPGDLVISEILAANENGLLDEDSTKIDPQPQDWIEIHNRGSSAVNLAGWSLTDERDAPGLWVFPSKTIPAGGYLVVFASGKNRTSPTGTNLLHTNFKLSPRGEFLGLYSPDSPHVLVDSLNDGYPEQRNDISYGRDGQGGFQYYSTPTPGLPNQGPTVSGLCEEVHFSAPRGHYSNPVQLYLTTATPGAFIRYTTDGTEPGPGSGTVFSSPITIAKNAIIRAAAYRDDLLPSKVNTHSYLYKQSAAVRSLPILSIVTATKNLTGPTGIIGIGPGYQNPDKHGIEWERPTSVEYILAKDNSGFQVDCGLRVQGSDYTRPRYTSDSKFSYRLYFRGDYGSGRLDYPLFADSPLQSFDQIVLRAGHNDISNPFILDEMVRQLSKDEGQVACHGTFVNLFVNGVFKGYYNPTERVEESFLQAYHGGSDQWDVITVGSAVQGGDGVAWNNLLTYVARTNVSVPSAYQEISRRMDLTNFVDYLFVNVYAATWDWPHNNWRAARNRTSNGPFRFYVWDAEGGFLSSRGPTFDSLTSSDSGLGSSAEIPNLFNKLRTSAEFRLLFADRVHKHFYNSGALVESNVLSRFFQLRDPLLSSISGFDNTIQTLWVPQRRKSLTTQLNNQKLIASTNAPVFNQFGGSVPEGFELSMKTFATNAQIFFTLNGSDPRVMFSNSVSPNAILYTNPIPLSKPTLVQARTLQGTNWSALSSTTFQIEQLQSPLRITEIMYNPEGGSPYEFVEIYNPSSVPLDLTGVSFVGISYLFADGTLMPPGARWVLTSKTDTNAFALRYPSLRPVGIFDGSLNNNGERIAILNKAGSVIVSVNYHDDNGWPIAADGLGYSLELIDPLGDPNSPANWRSSLVRHGTPGSEGTTSPAPIVLLNEVMTSNSGAVEHEGTFSDWIELLNPGSTPISLSGWSLSDDSNIRKFVFPGTAQIAPGEYLIVWCDDPTNKVSGFHTGFGLKQSGDQIFLYDSRSNRVDGVAFGRQVTNLTLGRLEDSWVLTEYTPGSANQAAAVAPASSLALNEWMVNPTATTSPWIELYNTSKTASIPLQGLYLGNSNSVQRITSLSFVGPGGYLQLFADGESGTDHINLSFSPRVGQLALFDQDGVEFQRVRYSGQTNLFSQGMLPDGSTNITSFPDTTSPGEANHLVTYTGPRFNELLVNDGTSSGWIELINTNQFKMNLSGMQLQFASMEGPIWSIPTNTFIEATGYLVVSCNSSQPPSTSALQSTNLQSGIALNGAGGAVYLLNILGQVVDRIEYGAQLPSFSLGRTTNRWQLLSQPSPGTGNAIPATLGAPVAVRINEWMSNPLGQADWLECFNTTNLPVDLGGSFLSDDPSSASTNQFRIPALTFIAPNGWLTWIADGEDGPRPGHVNFQLDPWGESLRLYATNGAVIDAIDYGFQEPGVSTGRLPDGGTNLVTFIGSESPGAPNSIAITDVVIQEVLTHGIASQNTEDAIELWNRTSQPIDISGWYLSPNKLQPRRYRIPAGSTLPPNGFWVTYQNDWSSSEGGAWSLDERRSGEVWLFAATPDGRLNGEATVAVLSPSQPGVSLGRHEYPTGSEYTAMSAPSFGIQSPSSLAQFRTGNGQANLGPKIGPVILSEVMYHPRDNASPSVEYVELENISGSPVSLGNTVANQAGWRLKGGIEFAFPSSLSLGSGARLLVVDFDPLIQPTRTAAFRSAFGIPGDTVILGPFVGKLANESDEVMLMEPLPAIDSDPEPTFSVVDRVRYESGAPWPVGLADGLGNTLQRRMPAGFGNDPESWIVGTPSPGKTTTTPAQPLPVIVLAPANTSRLLGQPASFEVVANGAGPLQYQWRHDGLNISGATNATLHIDPLYLHDAGRYDVCIRNGGGVVFSSAATLTVQSPLLILEPPLTQFVRGNVNSNITLRVLVRGDEPLSYQWSFKDQPLTAETNSTLTLRQIGAAQEGIYAVRVSNPISSKSASAKITVLFAPNITLQPQPLTVLAGETINLTAMADGTTPLSFRWRRNGSTVTTLASSNGANTYTITNARTTHSGNYSVVITNLASGATSIVATVSVLLDTDKDRLPDIWETANGFNPSLATDAAGDLDRDGVSNIDEYLSGTDPRDAQSFLKIDRIAANQGLAQVQFQALSNRTYTLIYQDNVGSPQWAILSHVLSRPTNRFENVLDLSATNRSRVYRLLTPMNP